MSPELELLDQLCTGSMPYLMMERLVFEGNRLRALRSIERMLSEGLLVISIVEEPVEDWSLSAWRRAPNGSSTTLALEQAQLSITDLGVRRLWGER